LIEEAKNDYQHDWQHQHQSFARSLLVLILTAPVDVVSGRELHLTGDLCCRFINKAADVSTTHVQQHSATQQAIFTGDHCRAFNSVNGGKLGQWNWCTGW